jgi:peptide chain release factor 1
VPETEKRGRVHSSTAVVVVMPEIPFEFEINKKDVRVEHYRSSGPGGQHVNKTESACRMTHVPTGITVAIQDERSQIDNTEKAAEVLRMRVYAAALGQNQIETRTERRKQMGQGELQEKIRTYNWPQERVTDHRLNKSVHGLTRMQAGVTLSEFLDDLVRLDQSKQFDEVLSL